MEGKVQWGRIWDWRRFSAAFGLFGVEGVEGGEGSGLRGRVGGMFLVG